MISRRFLLIGVVAAGLVSHVAQPSANATLRLMISANAGSSPAMAPKVIMLTSGVKTSQLNFSYDGFTFSLASAGSDLNAKTLTLGAGTITNTNSVSTGINTLTVLLSEDNYKSAGSFPLNLTSGASITTSAGTDTYQSYAGSGLNDRSGFSTATITVGGTGAGSGNTLASGFTPSGSTFSLTSVSIFQIAGGGGTVTSFGGVTTISTPEPATLALVFAGLPVIGLQVWRRRRTAGKAIVA